VAITPATATMLFGTTQMFSAQAYDAADQPMPNVTFRWSTSDASRVRLAVESQATALTVAEGLGAATVTATAVRGPAASAAVTVDPGSYVAMDTFTAPDGTPLAQHPPLFSQLTTGWEVYGTLTPVVVGGGVRAEGATGYSDEAVALLEGGTPDATVQVHWTPRTAPNLYAGLIFRASDERNYFLFEMWADRLRLSRVVEGIATELWLQPLEGEPRTGAHHLKAILAGPSIWVLWDSGVVHYQVQDPFNQWATKYGLRWNAFDTSATYDHFSIVGTPPPAVETLAVVPASMALAPYESITLTAMMTDASGAPVNGALAAWQSSNTAVARTRATGPGTAVITAAATGTGSITVTVPRGTAPPRSIPIDVRTCVDAFPITEYGVPYLANTAVIAVSAPGNCGWAAVRRKPAGHRYRWVITPELDERREFYLRQCGTWSESNQNGFISGEQLRENVIQHEAGFIQGHYAYYVAAQSIPTNNLGIAAERIVGRREYRNVNEFDTLKVRSDLDPYGQPIYEANFVEACGGEAERDSPCTPRGRIHWPPYSFCQ
jgi:uncharacterized protein YjdB